MINLKALQRVLKILLERLMWRLFLLIKKSEADFIEYVVAYFVKMFKHVEMKNDFADGMVSRCIVEAEYQHELYLRYVIQPALYNITITLQYP